MSPSTSPLPAIDEIRQLNRVVLSYVRAEPEQAIENFGLPPRAADLVHRASEEQVDRAAAFPRALFKLILPAKPVDRIRDAFALNRDSGRRVLQLTLLLSAWNLSRASGYSARLLMRLRDADVRELRTCRVDDLLQMSLADGVLRMAFAGLDWIWRELLTETRPEQRRRLLLIGFQPDDSIAEPVWRRRGARL